MGSERQELPARRESLMYPSPHSRGLNHVLDLFGVVHGAISDDNEQALWSLREILHLYGQYHERALEKPTACPDSSLLGFGAHVISEREALAHEARQEALLDAGPILAEHQRLKGEM